ncbi:hypothetical protein CK203_033838 [Vitis vinifera]|uniref:Uncharacterized protein n=1 Tax=Vitis vinifera TaxID=29760 RepID=A0A438IQW5_VITVI|nr:hypothetical protein CK203_033838 [Vitis vinifera]
MTAMKASPGYVNNTYWYPDSGATNHVTSDLNNLTFGIEYHGNNKIHMGNGEGPSHRKLLLWGNLHKGLYQFNPTKQQTSNASDHSSNICVTN